MEAAAAPRERAPSARPGRPARLLRLSGDDRLVALVRAGDERAFETLYDRHHRGVLSFCRHMLGTREEAEDAVQQTFLSAYGALLESDRPIALRAWLYAIARNRCLSTLRSRREHTALDVEPSVAGLAAEVEQREDLRQLLRDVAELPDDQRAALVLSELGDLSHDEIGQVIGVPTKKVKALVFQARESLLASRRARETPCAEVREQLATLRGGALRRAHISRHLRECPGCRGYREEVRRQRAAMAVLLPVVPAVGLKQSTLAAALGGGVGSGALGGAAVVKGTAAKVAIGLVLAGGAVTGGVVGVRQLMHSPPPPAKAGSEAGAQQRQHDAAAAPRSPASARSSGAAVPVVGRHVRRHHHHHASAPAAAPQAAAAPPVAPGREHRKPAGKRHHGVGPKHRSGTHAPRAHKAPKTPKTHKPARTHKAPRPAKPPKPNPTPPPSAPEAQPSASGGTAPTPDQGTGAGQTGRGRSN
jgi:RNA polymerase sigma factor (sigma-70 family)